LRMDASEKRHRDTSSDGLGFNHPGHGGIALSIKCIGDFMGMGRPPKEKSFANMLNIAIKEAVEGSDKTKLRAVADALVEKAMSGDVQAIKEVADRIDGKVPQAVVGDDELDPINLVHRIERVIVDTNDPDR